ncbi:hypothetical protein ACTFIT_002375 [Dictyostelium discoideum]
MNKILYYLLLFIFFFVHYLNSQPQQPQEQQREQQPRLQQSQDINNDIINIYVNSNYTNSNGNGTIVNPFQNLCVLNNLLPRLNNLNNTIIIINIGYGFYDIKKCTFSQLIIKNYNNITFIPYDFNNENNNNNNNNNNKIVLKNTYLIITNSTINFQNEIILNLNGFSFSFSHIEFNDGVEINFQGTLPTINYCNLKFKNSKFNFLYSTSHMECTNSLIEFIGSTLGGGEIIFYSGLEPIKDSGIIFRDNSFSIKNNLKMAVYKLHVENSVWIDSTVSSFSSIHFNETNIFKSQNQNDNQQQQQIEEDNPMFSLSNQDLFKINVILNIVNCKINYIDPHQGETSYSMISIFSSFQPVIQMISISNVEISGFNSKQPLIFQKGESSSLEINNVLIENCTSLQFIDSQSGDIKLSQMKFRNNKFKILIEIRNSNLYFYETGILCSDNNDIGLMVSFDTTTYLLTEDVETAITTTTYGRNNILLENLVFQCSGLFNFIKSDIRIESVRMESSFKNSLISLYNDCSAQISNSQLLSNSFESKSLFYINSSQLFIFNSDFSGSTASFVSAWKDSIIYLESTSWNKLFSKGKPNFIIEESYLHITNSTFDGVQSSSALIESYKSYIDISNTTINAFGSKSILYSESSQYVILSDLVLNGCFSQDQLFYIYQAQTVDIKRCIFNNNRGYGYNLFKFINCTTVNIEFTKFIGNSFSPLIQSYQSSLILQSITLIGNSGSFINSIGDVIVKVYNLTYTDNLITYDYLFVSENTRSIILNSITINNNYFNNFLFIFDNVSNLFFNDFTLSNNLLSEIDKNDTPMILFQNCQITSFINFNIINNSISKSLFKSTNSRLVFARLIFSSNQITGIDNSFIDSLTSNIIITNSIISNNNGNCKSLINLNACSLTIDSTNFQGNYFIQNGDGSIISYKSIINEKIGNNFFQISNSIFYNNFGKFGAVFSFYNFSLLNDTKYPIINNNSIFNNNSFISNTATQQGGVFYTKNFLFNLNSTLFNSNIFLNNIAFCGINFSSEFNKVIFKNKNVINGLNSLIEYNLLDYYGNIFTPLSTTVNISITRVSNMKSIIIPSVIIVGVGNFKYQFIGDFGENYIIETINGDNDDDNDNDDDKSNISFKETIMVLGCLQYQYFNETNDSCNYCSVDFSYSPSLKKCYQCDPDKISCLTSSVVTNDGYYLVNQDVSMVEECPVAMCLSNNTCLSNNSFGNLCFSCKDQFGNVIQSKNGIRCCSSFKPNLIIPILIIVYLIFGLSLSLLKYNLLEKPIGQIIIFLQINSVVFFSYSGVYILPLFRMSIDLFDGVCLFKGLNANYKFFISLFIITSLFFIGSTDITLNLLEFTLKRIFKFSNYPNFLNKILIGKVNQGKIYKWKSIWSLYQIFIIPLLFNSICFLISKTINNIDYLSIDFSINYKSKINQLCITLSIIIILMISLISIISIISFLIFKFKTLKRILKINNSNNNSNDNNNNNQNSNNRKLKSYFISKLNLIFLNFYRLQLQLNYKRNFKYWDNLILLKSLLLVILSISFIFNFSHFMTFVITIQIIYTTIHFLFNPIKKELLPITNFNNLTNLLQLIIFIISDSTLLKSVSLFNQGKILTKIIFQQQQQHQQIILILNQIN